MRVADEAVEATAKDRLRQQHAGGKGAGVSIANTGWPMPRERYGLCRLKDGVSNVIVDIRRLVLTDVPGLPTHRLFQGTDPA